MSVLEIYGIYDEASEAYVQFIPAINEQVAKMSLEKMYKERRLNVPLLYDYPGTFKAMKLGTFNDNTGLFENVNVPLLLLDFGSLDVKTSLNS